MIYVRLERDIVTVITEEIFEEEPNPEVRWEPLKNLLGRTPNNRDIATIQPGFVYNAKRREFTPHGISTKEVLPDSQD